MPGQTEFEDILISHGILQDPDDGKQKEEQLVFDIATSKNEEDDNPEDEEDDSFFEQYKQKRFSELGSNEVLEISRPDFVKEVTEASKQMPVLVHLYNDSIESSQLLKTQMRSLAPGYPKLKFVEIVASRCIPDYPDALVPTILYYQNGSVIQKITNANPTMLATFLNACNEYTE